MPEQTVIDEVALARLAEAVRSRRRRLGRPQDALASFGGPSSRAVRDVEQGRSPAPSEGLLAKLDRGLDWPDDTAAAVLHDRPGALDAARGHTAALARVAGPGRGSTTSRARLTQRDNAPDNDPSRMHTGALAAELLARLAQQERTPAVEESLTALHRLLPELFARERGARQETWS